MVIQGTLNDLVCTAHSGLPVSVLYGCGAFEAGTVTSAAPLMGAGADVAPPPEGVLTGGRGASSACRDTGSCTAGIPCFNTSISIIRVISSILLPMLDIIDASLSTRAALPVGLDAPSLSL